MRERREWRRLPKREPLITGGTPHRIRQRADDRKNETVFSALFAPIIAHVEFVIRVFYLRHPLRGFGCREAVRHPALTHRALSCRPFHGLLIGVESSTLLIIELRRINSTRPKTRRSMPREGRSRATARTNNKNSETLQMQSSASIFMMAMGSESRKSPVPKLRSSFTTPAASSHPNSPSAHPSRKV